MLAAMEEHERVLTLPAAAVAEESYATEAAVDAALAAQTATLEATAPALAAAEAEVGAALAASAEAALRLNRNRNCTVTRCISYRSGRNRVFRVSVLPGTTA